MESEYCAADDEQGRLLDESQGQVWAAATENDLGERYLRASETFPGVPRVLAEEQQSDVSDQEEREHHRHSRDGELGAVRGREALAVQDDPEGRADEGHHDRRHRDQDDEWKGIARQGPELVDEQRGATTEHCDPRRPRAATCTSLPGWEAHTEVTRSNRVGHRPRRVSPRRSLVGHR